MHSTTVSRTLPFVLLSCLLSAPHPAQCQKPNSGKNTQFTNGQNGTPNLSLAASRFIDWTHMGNLVGQTAKASMAIKAYDTNAPEVLKRYITELNPQNPEREQQRKVDYATLHALVTNAYEAVRDNKIEEYQSFYIGTEARGGDGHTTFVLPSLNYSNEANGYEIGGEFLTSAGNRSDNGPDSFGVSFKYEITDQARALIKALRAQHQHPFKEEGVSNLKLLYKIFASSTDHPINVTDKNDLDNVVGSPQPLDFVPQGDFKGSQVLPLNSGSLSNLTLSESGKDDFLQEYIKKSQEPAVAFNLGRRFLTDDGTLTDAGLSASILRPFGKGKPGVTLLYVLQGFHADFRHDTTRDAVRNGAALVFQDRTPALNETAVGQYLMSEAAYKPDTLPSPLRPTWKYKIGLEYTSPVLGLTKSFAGFVRYRDPNSYAEITLTYGEDGLGKDYGDISIGRSYTF